MKMTDMAFYRRWREAIALIAIAWAMAAHDAALAGPGAHGPGGEHLEGPAPTSGGNDAPRVEASSELFELVARLEGGELSILIDRFETNEPVLGASVDVESGGLKAKATFHADHGDYAIDDAALLKKLAEPGEHALVFSVVVGKDSDLLDGTLKIAAPAPEHGHDAGRWPIPLAGAILVAVLAAAILLTAMRRRRARMHRSLATAGGRS